MTEAFSPEMLVPVALLLGILATFVWRLAGVVIGSRVDPESGLFRWFTCVAYALVAGLMMRVALMPGGDMDPTRTGLRALAVAIGFAAWYWRGKSLPWGLVAGVSSFAVIVALGG